MESFGRAQGASRCVDSANAVMFDPGDVSRRQHCRSAGNVG